MHDGNIKRAEVLVLTGLPASGKTTWAKEFVSRPENLNKWVRINRDDLRHMSGQYWVPDREDYITNLENTAMIEAMKYGLGIILDATNFRDPTERIKNANIHALHMHPVKIEFKNFDVPLATCIERDKNRENPVGAKVIRGMYNKYLKNKPKSAVIEYRKQDTDKPVAYVFDIDGTVAMMNGRTPYEWKKVGEDLPNNPVCNLAYELSKNAHIIFLSGRDGSCYEETKGWLTKYTAGGFDLIMREAGDQRKDSIIKKELYEEHIFPNYYVAGVFDDRDCVVKMVRDELKLPCYQVFYGDF